MNQKGYLEKPFLPYPLDEFRFALEDEIEVAKRNESGNAIPLHNGRKIDMLVGFYKYEFKLDSILNRPDGMPCDLIVLGKANPFSATIVSTEGINIILSIETDLGDFISSARLQANLSILMRKLIERIESKGDGRNPAALRMMGDESLVRGAPDGLANRKTLNDQQLQALESALGRNLTVIWGPPGTGKTHVIGTIAEQLHQRARTVLIVSHTNTAVDQAIRHIAKALKDEGMPIGGVVLRIGDPKGEELKGEYEEVILKKQVEIQSRELASDRQRFLKQKEFLLDESARLNWLISSASDIKTIGQIKEANERLSLQVEDRKVDYERVSFQIDEVRKTKVQTDYILQLRKDLATAVEQLASIETEITLISQEMELENQSLANQKERVNRAEKIKPVREARQKYPGQAEYKEHISILSQKTETLMDNRTELLADLALQNAILDETVNAGRVERLIKRMPSVDQQKSVIEKLKKELSGLNADLEASQKAKDQTISYLSSIINMDVEISRYEGIKSVEAERQALEMVEKVLEKKRNQLRELEERDIELKALVRINKDKIDKYSATYNNQVEKKNKEASEQILSFKEMKDFLDLSNRQIHEGKVKIKGIAETLAADAKELDPDGNWFDAQYENASEMEKAEMLGEFSVGLHQHLGLHDLVELNDRKEENSKKIESITLEIRKIDAILQGIEKEIIRSASIIGATLTKSYLSDDIQAREFDTVILDEASMAPIPALWMAGQLSKNNLVIVGDFKQIPPIVLSTKDLTLKWLGRDVFKASGIQEKWETKQNVPAYFIPLKLQRRMVKEIADIASHHFYDGMIETDTANIREKEQAFLNWFPRKQETDCSPVVLLDMGQANAWVTSVVKGGNSSRLNFLSASISVDLAQKILSDVKVTDSGSQQNRRILIISPYRSHANLVTVLLSSNNSQEPEAAKQMIISGTAHSFQGSEADVVIFDLVVDEPHFKVNFFIPGLDDQLKRLLNVAITRAKFKLYVIGDFSYCRRLGKNAFLGRELLPYLQDRFPTIDARSQVPDGFADRAAKGQTIVIGGMMEADHERTVMLQDAFYRYLFQDMQNCKEKMVIYSPFITPDRLSFLLPQLTAARERKVDIYVVTKAHTERKSNELSRIKECENQLKSIGAFVIHKLNMHEKLIFFDDDILWSGSLNPLSFYDTREIMERRESKEVVKHYAQILRLDELLEVQGQPAAYCPVCGEEMIAAEGADDPYYWRCVNDHCFTRSIDQPYPVDGIIRCASCGGGLEFGYWGKDPYWRCQMNNKHRLKIHKYHLKLPKMAALIPKKDVPKIGKIL
jgi:hypothetical protein